MTKRSRKLSGARALARLFTMMGKAAVRARKVATKQAKAIKPPAPRQPSKAAGMAANWHTEVAVSKAGACRYYLFTPPDVRRTERLPLLVMLHGCEQDANSFAASSAMNRLAARKRFFVLYPQQERLSNIRACWHWYDTRSGRAQREAALIEATIEHVAKMHPVDTDRMALAGLSAGAAMAALVVTRRPERFRALAMHSGIGTGVAQSSASALMAMRGRKAGGTPLPPCDAARWPALLVLHGSADHVVAPSNGLAAARQWAACCGAQPGRTRSVQRGARYAMEVTDYRARGRLVATHCHIKGLSHAWSGGAPGLPHSDSRGPDASGMVWTFVAKQFK